MVGNCTEMARAVPTSGNSGEAATLITEVLWSGLNCLDDHVCYLPWYACPWLLSKVLWSGQKRQRLSLSLSDFGSVQFASSSTGGFVGIWLNFPSFLNRAQCFNLMVKMVVWWLNFPSFWNLFEIAQWSHSMVRWGKIRRMVPFIPSYIEVQVVSMCPCFWWRCDQGYVDAKVDVYPEGDGRGGSRDREGGKAQSSCHRSSGFMRIKMILITMIRLDSTTLLAFLGNLTTTCETPSPPSLCLLPDFVDACV